jgi:hypothetical protein
VIFEVAGEEGRRLRRSPEYPVVRSWTNSSHTEFRRIFVFKNLFKIKEATRTETLFEIKRYY